MDREIITITNPDGKDVEYELVTIIENENTDIKYLVYKDIIDDEESEDIDLYISKSYIEDGKEIIEEIEDEEEWNNVTKVLDEIFNEK